MNYGSYKVSRPGRKYFKSEPFSWAIDFEKLLLHNLQPDLSPPQRERVNYLSLWFQNLEQLFMIHEAADKFNVNCACSSCDNRKHLFGTQRELCIFD